MSVLLPKYAVRASLRDRGFASGTDSLFLCASSFPLVLAPGCPAIDAGAILPNINDAFVGSAPDLGAYEDGQPLPTYGPRPDATSPSVVARTSERRELSH